jgi:hypothetical protein
VVSSKNKNKQLILAGLASPSQVYQEMEHLFVGSCH